MKRREHIKGGGLVLGDLKRYMCEHLDEIRTTDTSQLMHLQDNQLSNRHLDPAETNKRSEMSYIKEMLLTASRSDKEGGSHVLTSDEALVLSRLGSTTNSMLMRSKMTLQNDCKDNRIVTARFTTAGGWYVEVGILLDLSRPFVGRYDVSGAVIDFVIFSKNFVFYGVTSEDDMRRGGSSAPVVLSEAADVFVVGSRFDDTGGMRPLILSLTSDFKKTSTVYTGDDRGHLYDVIVDTESNSVYGCGRVFDPDTQLPDALIIKIPLYKLPDGGDYTPRIGRYHHSSPSDFKRIALDGNRLIVCTGFKIKNRSDTDFDYLVKYYPGDEVYTNDPFSVESVIVVRS